MTAKPRDHGPGIFFPPPLWYALGLCGGWLLGRANPLPSLPSPADLIVGITCAVLGAGFGFSAIVDFLRAHTAFLPHRPSTDLVIRGPYRITRNPMYVGMALLYIGIACLLHWSWALPLLPLVLLAVTRLVIAREELYLESKFGNPYRAYKGRVRRWL